MADFYFASVNEDGSYGEPQRWDGVQEITPITSSDPETMEYPSLFQPEEVTCEIKLTQEWDVLFWYLRKIADRTCIACKNCKHMYHYPGFVDAEEYECTAGLECDTWFGSVKNCTKYEVLPYGEDHPRNPDLDKYPYVLKGE